MAWIYLTIYTTDEELRPLLPKNSPSSPTLSLVSNKLSSGENEARRRSTDQLYTDCLMPTSSQHDDHHNLKSTISNTKKYTRSSIRDNSTPSDVQSIFNCDLPDAKCKYYYPANFFDENCGIGNRYVKHIRDAEEKRNNFTLLNYMPNLGFPTITLNHTCIMEDTSISRRYERKQKRKKAFSITKNASGPNDILDERPHSSSLLTSIGQHSSSDKNTKHCLTERITFVHVHKAGGTSLQASLDKLSSKVSVDLKQTTTFRPYLKPIGKDTDTEPILPKQNEKKTQSFQNSKTYLDAMNSLSYATHYPKTTFDPNQHVIFSFVRDPLERFVSSIGQAIGGDGSQRNRISNVLVNTCVKSSSSRKTLKCLAKYVQKNGFWIELHFIPQVIDLWLTILWQDVPVSLFSFKDLGIMLDYLDRSNVHRRNGKKGSYRAETVLTKMTVDDYDDESARIVCEIYEMDVIMQRSLGMEVPRCDQYV